MNIFRLAVELFVIYLLYKLVFEFIIPVYKTTKQLKRKMGEMQQHMQSQQPRDEAPYVERPSHQQTSKASFSDDYIEYEEIK